MRKEIKFLIILKIIALVFILDSCTNPIQEKADLIEKSIIEVIDSVIINNNRLDALSVGIVSPFGNFEIHKGKLLNGNLPNSNSQYEIASISKTFLGLLLVKAVQEKRINLNEDIRKYLVGDFLNLEYENVPISFKHLATHRSGLPLFFPYQKNLFETELNWDSIPFQWNRVQNGYSKKQFFKELQSYILIGEPGVNTAYSNVGANLSGCLLENIYNKQFSELLIDAVFSPLGMKDTYPSLSSVDLKQLPVQGKNRNGLLMPFRVAKEMNAEGGIISNVSDMIKYIQFNLELDSQYSLLLYHEIIEGSNDVFHKGLFWQFEIKDGAPTEIY